MLALADAGVVEVPRLGPLAARVPAAEVVAQREDALLGPRALLVAARPAEERVEAVLLDRVEQRRRLQPVARRARAGLLDDAPGVDRRLDRGDDEALVQLGHAAVAEREDLGEVVPRVDVQQREREAGRAERLLRQAQEDDGVLAAAEHQRQALALRGDLPHDVDGFRLEGAQMGDGAGVHAAATAARVRERWTSAAATPAARGAPTIAQAGDVGPGLAQHAEGRAEQDAAQRRPQPGRRDVRQQRGAEPDPGQRARRGS